MNDRPENQKEKYQEEVDSFAKEVDAMKRSKADNVLGWIFAILFTVLALMAGWVGIRNANIISDLERENEELKIENAELQNAQDFLEEFLELQEEIYEGKINEAVLEERIKWLKIEAISSEFDYTYASQMWDDFETLLGAAHEYGSYDEAFFEYFIAHYPAVYARFEQYDEAFE